MAAPIASKRFIMKTFDGAQSLWPRDSGDVFPFFITLQYLDGNNTGQPFVDTPVFFDFPHIALCIYQLWYVKSADLPNWRELARYRCACCARKR